MAIAVIVALGIAGVTAPGAFAAGSISGLVTGAPSHGPVPGVEVCARHSAAMKDDCDFTSAEGAYEIEPLAPGEYEVIFWPRVHGQNYAPASWDPDEMWPTDPLTVTDAAVTGIDKELPEGGTIRGLVTDEVGGQPIAGVPVCAAPGYEHDDEDNCETTGADGRYEIVGLWNRDYRVEFRPDDVGLQYFGEYYEDQPFGEGPPKMISMATGSVMSAIDATLEPAADVRGTVTAAVDGRPLSGILVCVAPPDAFYNTLLSQEIECARTTFAGTYRIKQLEGGPYHVLFSVELREYLHFLPPLEPEEDGFPTKFWSEKNYLGEADVLTLDAPTVATKVDARLGPPPPPVRDNPQAPNPYPVEELRHPTKPKCKRGQRMKKDKGKRRCVRRHPKKHHRGSAPGL